MTRFELEAVVAAGPAAVWDALMDTTRWGTWAAGDVAAPAGVTTCSVAPLAGPIDRVGALRGGVSTVRVPLLGTRTAHWVDQVTDLAHASTIEYESIEGLSPATWRLRLWLVPQMDGQTRVRCRVLFRAASVLQQVALALFLGQALRRHAAAMLDGLVAAFAAPSASAVTPESEPVFIPDAPAEPAVEVALVERGDVGGEDPAREQPAAQLAPAAYVVGAPAEREPVAA